MFYRLVVCSLVLGVAGLSRADDPKEKPAAEQLVGTWKLTGSSQGVPDAISVVVEFTKDGKMAVRYVPKEKGMDPVITNGTYKVEKDTIDYTMDDRMGGKKQEKLKIDKLTADELVVTDPDGVKEEFKREKPDGKKDEKKKDDR